MGFQIERTGVYVPEKIVSNTDLERRLNLKEGTIERLVGIRTRRFSSEQESCCYMGLEAAMSVLESEADFGDIGMVMFGKNTIHGEVYHFEHEFIHSLTEKLNVSFFGEPVFLPGSCTLLVNAFIQADRYLAQNQDKKVLVVSATDQSKYLDFNDKDTAILFGDGAFAALLSYAPIDIRYHEIHDYSGYKAVYLNKDGKIEMPNGLSLYKFILRNVQSFIKYLQDTKSINWYLFHQAQGHLMQTLEKKLNIPSEKMLNSYRDYGNMSNVSQGVGLHEAIKDGRIQRGDILLFVTYGTGIQMKGCLLEY